jgi:hypothetical protein
MKKNFRDNSNKNVHIWRTIGRKRKTQSSNGKGRKRSQSEKESKEKLQRALKFNQATKQVEP